MSEYLSRALVAAIDHAHLVDGVSIVYPRDLAQSGNCGHAHVTILVVSIHPESLAGHSLVDVTSSWHEFACKRSARPVHVWLTVSGIGTMQLHTLNGLRILNEPVYSSHDMNEYGQIVVEATALPALRRWLGHHIDHVSLLHQDPPDATVGMVLHFHEGSVGIADLGDELIVDEWPGSNWERLGVTIEHPN